MWVISFTSCLHCMLDLIHMTLILLPGSRCSELGVEPGKDFGSGLSMFQSLRDIPSSCMSEKHSVCSCFKVLIRNMKGVYQNH